MAALEVVREAADRDADEAARLYKLLAAPMPVRMLDVPGRPKMPYVEVEQVISRLNAVLGVSRWSFAGVERWHEADSDCCCMRGLLSVHWPDGVVTHHEDVGGQVVNRRKDGTALEMANDWKGAQSDCLKRCATQIGVGLFLRSKTRQVSELPSDQPQRDRQAAGSSAVAASTSAVSVPAPVARGEGAGREGMPQDGVPPNSRPNPPQPAADDWKPAAIERIAMLKQRAAELGIAVTELPKQGRTRQVVEDWCADLGRQLLAEEDARKATAAAYSAPESEHPQGSIEWLWQQWKATKARAEAAGLKVADPPDAADATALLRFIGQLEKRVAETGAPF